MLQPFIETLASEFGMEDSLLTQTKGLYQFPIEGGVISILDIPPGCAFNCTLAPCPQENREAFLTEVMFANLFFKGTNGAILGLDESGKLLTLSQNVEYTTNYKAFKETLEDFANTVDFWKQQAVDHK